MNRLNRNHFTDLFPCRFCGMEPMRIYCDATDRYAVKCDCGKRHGEFPDFYPEKGTYGEVIAGYPTAQYRIRWERGSTSGGGDTWWAHGDDIEPYTATQCEPIKLYCVEDFDGELVKGRVYEFDGHQVNYEQAECYRFRDFDAWKRGDPDFSRCLVPLAKRPAKAGEWVLPNDDWFKQRGISNKRIFKVEKIDCSGDAWFDGGSRCASSGKSCAINYLVLDGYKGGDSR